MKMRKMCEWVWKHELKSNFFASVFQALFTQSKDKTSYFKKYEEFPNLISGQ